ncbi:unnamed protein product [Rhodiola kirilowii]
MSFVKSETLEEAVRLMGLSNCEVQFHRCRTVHGSRSKLRRRESLSWWGYLWWCW